MGNILFIINPIAGAGKAKTLIPLIENTMDKHKIEFNIIITQKPKEATNITEDNIPHYKTIVAVGGDGTVNEVARGIINKNSGVLGVIPAGTGNDMAKSLGISTDPEKALHILINGDTTTIDIGRVNNSNFLNISSVGFDAEVVFNNNKIKKKIKSEISYALSVLYTLFQFRKRPVDIEIDGKKTHENIVLLAVGNGKYYGGGMKILPDAKLDDGELDICIVSNINKLTLLFLFPTIFKGNHIKHTKYVKIDKGKHIKITSKEIIPINIDGELMEGKEVDFSLEHQKMLVICDIEV